MKDKILKYMEFIKEDVENRSAILMRGKLTKIKNALEKLISSDDENEGNDEIQSISVLNAKEKGNKDLTLKDLGVTQDSSELLKNRSSIVDSITFKFSDGDSSSYTLYISTSIKDNVAAQTEDDVKKFLVNFKKYNSALEYYGDINKNNVEINIDDDNNLKISVLNEKEGQESEESGESGGMSLEDFLLDMKLEIDKTYGGEEEGLDFETE